MESVQSTSASASSSSSLASHHFLVKISGHALVLHRLLSSYCNDYKIITATSIMISPLLRVSQPLLSLKKLCRYKHNDNRPILRNTIVFGSGDGIEGLPSPKSVLYNCSHVAVGLGHLILRDVISLLCRRSGGCEGGGGGMKVALS